MLLEEIKNKHSGKDCLLCGCGPSLNDYTKEELLKFAENKIIICIKDSITKLKDECDYFVANTFRHNKFEFNKKTIKLLHHSSIHKVNMNDSHVKLNNYDIVMNTYNYKSRNDWIEIKKNFEDFLFSKRIERDLNFGIITFALYLCEYLGIKNIYTIGWDSYNKKKPDSFCHFFKEPKIKRDNLFYPGIEKSDKATPDLYNFYKNMGISIYIIKSENCFITDIIPRVTIK